MPKTPLLSKVFSVSLRYLSFYAQSRIDTILLILLSHPVIPSKKWWIAWLSGLV